VKQGEIALIEVCVTWAAFGERLLRELKRVIADCVELLALVARDYQHPKRQGDRDARRCPRTCGR
jgi:hypothetical protein